MPSGKEAAPHSLGSRWGVQHGRPKFVLIEQSLRRVGGHFCEYAREIARAAEEAGYDPVLAINSRFSDRTCFPDRWPVLPIFPHTSDRIHRVPRSYGLGLDELSDGNLQSLCYRLWDGMVDWFKSGISRLRWHRRRVRARGFATACESLFQHIKLHWGDQVFCSTVSDMDLLGLVEFLSAHDETTKVDWHLQFHFSIYSGREPDYDAQEPRVAALRRRFAAALTRVPNHRIHFYTTTEHLARQFHRLDVGRFTTLPWPVSRRFKNTARPARNETPLRLVCAGGVRREKGGDHFSSLVNAIWDDCLKTQKVQLLFQDDGRRRTKAMLGLPPGAVTAANTVDASRLPRQPLVSVPHPLSPNDYATYIKNADIGLALYDAREYYVRCSGVLVEMLAAGIPVIVPSGCWLGDQVEQINFGYLHGLLNESSDHQHWRVEDVSWRYAFNSQSRPARTHGALVVDSRGVTAEFEVPQRAAGGDVIVSVDRPQPQMPGTYLQCSLQQYNASGEGFSNVIRIVGGDAKDPQSSPTDSDLIRPRVYPSISLFPIEASTVRAALTLRNAYHDHCIPVQNCQIRCLPSAPTASGHRPTGFVGLTATCVKQIPDLLKDMVSNYELYWTAAQTFAKTWGEQHAPSQTIQRIQQQSQRPLPGLIREAG